MKTLFTFLILFSSTIALNAQVYLGFGVNAAVDTIAANIDNPIFTILDVRTLGEYEQGHIAQAHLRDFYAEDFEAQLDSLDKSRTYLVYCQSGGRSGSTLPIMEDLGFERVYDMYGGMGSWLAADLPVTTELPDPVNIYAFAASIAEPSLAIKLFPNPSENFVYFDAHVLFDEVALYNSKGCLLKNHMQQGKLDLSDLPQGQYFLTCMVKGKVYTQKLSKL